MAKDVFALKVDTSTLENRLSKLKKRIKSKKSQELWPSLASRMATIYKRMYAENWPHVRSNTSDYQDWKRHWGFPTRKLEMTGRLRSHLTDGDKLINNKKTNESTLTLSPDGVSTSATGPGAGVAPKSVDEVFNFPDDRPLPDTSTEFIKNAIGVGWFESQPHKLAPFNYPEALGRGFSGSTAWGSRGQSFSVAAMGNFLWTAEFLSEIQIEGADFLFEQVKKVWGSTQVSRGSRRR